MNSFKGKIVPILITIVIIIIIFFFASAKQPIIVCEKTTKDIDDIKIVENIETSIYKKHIDKIFLVKTIIIPIDLAKEDEMVEIVKSVNDAYEYIKDKVEIIRDKNIIKIKINIDDKETIMLNNIKFENQNKLKININPNTKSKEVITLSVGDNYKDNELIARLKKEGYTCK